MRTGARRQLGRGVALGRSVPGPVAGNVMARGPKTLMPHTQRDDSGHGGTVTPHAGRKQR